MRHTTTLALLIALLTAASAWGKDYTYTTAPGDMMHSRIYTLDNGLTVYMTVNDEKPRIQTYIAVRTGSRNDPAETTGLAHYLEHLMFKGTTHFGTTDASAEKPLLDEIEARYEAYRKLTDKEARRKAYHEIDSVSGLAARYNIPNEYDKLMSSIGAEGTNAYTSTDVTCYTEDIPSNEIEAWAKIQSDRFENMVIRGFHTELEAVYEEYNIGLSNDFNKEFEAANAKLFPHHPYGTQTTIGTQEHLKNPSITNIKRYFRRYYAPNNVAICLSGDLDPDKTIAIIDRHFGSWKAAADVSAPQYAPVKKLTAPTDTTVTGQEAENVMLAWQFAGGGTRQCDTLQVVDNILANGVAGLIDLDINNKMTCQQAAGFIDPMTDYSSYILYGMPNEGQTLDDVKTLLLAEIQKLKRGEFSDELLTSVKNNLKLQYYTSLENNDKRAKRFVDAFINRVEWPDAVGQLDRINGMTKEQITAFAARHFTDGFVTVYKRQGTDSTLAKIDKPQITAIPSNREYQSAFVADITAHKAEPIEPKFVDFDTDIQRGKTKRGLPYLYVNNTTNNLFSLSYHIPTGAEANKWLATAASYFSLLGTGDMTSEQVQEAFYRLACKMYVAAGDDATDIVVSGLAENYGEALALTEKVLAGAVADSDKYKSFVAQILKGRNDAKHEQSENFAALYDYGCYGKYNPTRNQPSAAELEAADPATLVDMIRTLTHYTHEVAYYGPDDAKTAMKAVDKLHKMPRQLSDKLPAARPYVKQQTAKPEILLAPYDAKNINMREYYNEGHGYDKSVLPVVTLFNEYFGGGMNTIVFQELRESRALAYSAWATYSVPRRPDGTQSVTTSIMSQNDKMMDCINAFREIIDTMPQSQKAFDLAKQATMKRYATMRTPRRNYVWRYFAARKLGQTKDINEYIYRALPALTMDDMVKFEKERMAGKPYLYMILGDEKNLDIPALERIAPIRRLTTEEIFGY